MEQPGDAGEDGDTHQLPQGQSRGAAPSLCSVASPETPPPLTASRSGLRLGVRKRRQGKSAAIPRGREASPPRGLPPTSATGLASPRCKPRPVSLPGFITRHRRVHLCRSHLFYELNLPNKAFPPPPNFPPSLLSQVAPHRDPPPQTCSTAPSTGFGKVSGCTTTRRYWQQPPIAAAFIPSSSSTPPATGRAPTPGGSSSMPCGTWMEACGKWAPGESQWGLEGIWWGLEGLRAHPAPRQAVRGAGLPGGGVPLSLSCLGDDTVDLRGGHRTPRPPA